MRYQKMINLQHHCLAKLPPMQRGQHVAAGRDGPFGRFVGVSPAGVLHVAWHGDQLTERSRRFVWREHR